MKIRKSVKYFFQNYKGEILIFILAVSLRLFFFYFVAANVNFVYEDLRADGYYEIAYNLVHHGVFSISYPEIDSHRTPGLPFLLVPFLFVKNIFGFLILQILVGSFLPVLGRRLMLLLNLPAKIATGIAVFLAVDPLGIKLSLTMLTETFFTLFFLLFIFFAVHFIRSISAVPVNRNKIIRTVICFGALLGLATLFRPTTLYLPLLLTAVWVLWRFFSKQKMIWRYIVFFLLTAWLLPMGWIFRNYHTFGTVAYSSIQADVFYTALAPSVLAFKEDVDYSTAQNHFFSSEGLMTYPEINVVNAADFQKKAGAFILAHPQQFMGVVATSLFTFFTHDGALDFLGILGLNNGVSSYFPHGWSIFKQSFGQFVSMVIRIVKTPLIFVLFTRLVWLIIALAFVFSLVYQIISKKIDVVGLFFLICIFYFALTSIANGLAINARFRFPVNTLIFIFVAQSVYSFWAHRRQVN